MTEYQDIYLSADIPDNAREIRNLKEIRDWCRESDLISTDRQEKWAESLLNDSKIKMYSVWNNNNEYLGTTGLTSISWYHRTAEWSLFINPKYQKRGYATKALMALLDHAFNSLNLNKVWGEIFSTNEACLNLANKIGFSIEGRLKDTYYKNGQYISSVMVGMLKEDFYKKYLELK